MIQNCIPREVVFDDPKDSWPPGGPLKITEFNGLEVLLMMSDPLWRSDKGA